MMEKVKEILKDKTKLYIVLSIIGLIILIVSVALIINIGKKNDNSKELIEKFEIMGLDFYENFYYPQIGTTTEEIGRFLAKYTTTGIKISLNNLDSLNYKEEEYGEALVELLEKCDKKETKIVIYPEAPYEQKSYRTETILECNFEK